MVAAVDSGDPTELRNFERSRRIELAHARDAIATPLHVEDITNLLSRLRRVDEPKRRNDPRVMALLDVMESFTLRPRQVSAHAVGQLESFADELDEALAVPVTTAWREDCVRDVAEDACRAPAALDGFDFERREPRLPDGSLVGAALQAARPRGAGSPFLITQVKAPILACPPVFPPMDASGPGWSRLFSAETTPPRVAAGNALRELIEKIQPPETLAHDLLPTRDELHHRDALLAYMRMFGDAEQAGPSVVEFGC